jgi:hypothetical protein
MSRGAGSARLLSVIETARELGISRSLVYELLASGALRFELGFGTARAGGGTGVDRLATGFLLWYDGGTIGQHRPGKGREPCQNGTYSECRCSSRLLQQ